MNRDVMTSRSIGTSLIAVESRVPEVELVARYPLSFSVLTTNGFSTTASSVFCTDELWFCADEESLFAEAGASAPKLRDTRHKPTSNKDLPKRSCVTLAGLRDFMFLVLFVVLTPPPSQNR